MVPPEPDWDIANATIAALADHHGVDWELRSDLPGEEDGVCVDLVELARAMARERPEIDHDEAFRAAWIEIGQVIGLVPGGTLPG